MNINIFSPKYINLTVILGDKCNDSGCSEASPSNSCIAIQLIIQLSIQSEGGNGKLRQKK